MTARRLVRKALTPLVAAAVGSLLLLTVTGGGAAAAQEAEEHLVEGTAELTWAPAELQINPGDTVTFEVTGSPPHPVSPAAGAADFDAAACGLDAMSAEGDSCQVAFEEEGTFDYVCTVHESVGMVGTIVVGEGGDAPAESAGEEAEPTTTVLDTPVAATSEEGPPVIYYAGWGLLALGALIALAAVVGYLRFAPDFRRSDK